MGDPIDQMSLVMKLDSSDPDERDAAAYALQGSTITDGSAAMILVGKLESRDPDVQKAAAFALAGTTITDPQAAGRLAQIQKRL